MDAIKLKGKVPNERGNAYFGVELHGDATGLLLVGTRHDVPEDSEHPHVEGRQISYESVALPEDQALPGDGEYTWFFINGRDIRLLGGVCEPGKGWSFPEDTFHLAFGEGEQLKLRIGGGE